MQDERNPNEAVATAAAFFVGGAMSTEATKETYGAQLVRHARILYQNIASELSRSLEDMKSDEDDPGAKARIEMIRSHRKALQMVLEFEQQFSANEEGEEADHELDLTSAREEVYRRLDRIIADVAEKEAD